MADTGTMDSLADAGLCACDPKASEGEISVLEIAYKCSWISRKTVRSAAKYINLHMEHT